MMDSKRYQIDDLTLIQLLRTTSWRTINESDDIEPFIEPAMLGKDKLLLSRNGICWCLGEAEFSNKSKWLCVCRCEADSNEKPILWSVWNGLEFIPIMVPPVPDFVLELEGPDFFSSKFKLDQKHVFPVIITLVDEFEEKPSVRKVIIEITGVLD